MIADGSSSKPNSAQTAYQQSTLSLSTPEGLSEAADLVRTAFARIGAPDLQVVPGRGLQGEPLLSLPALGFAIRQIGVEAFEAVVRPTPQAPPRPIAAPVPRVELAIEAIGQAVVIGLFRQAIMQRSAEIDQQRPKSDRKAAQRHPSSSLILPP